MVYDQCQLLLIQVDLNFEKYIILRNLILVYILHFLILLHPFIVF